MFLFYAMNKYKLWRTVCFKKCCDKIYLNTEGKGIMQRMRLDKKRKSTTTRKKRPLLKINSQCLELLIKENSGNSSKYCVPAKTIAVKVRTSKIHVSQQSKKTSNTWKIVGENVRVVKPEELVNKEIYLRRGRKRVKGVVLEVKPLGKGPEGKPVPTPPPDLD